MAYTQVFFFLIRTNERLTEVCSNSVSANTELVISFFFFEWGPNSYEPVVKGSVHGKDFYYKEGMKQLDSINITYWIIGNVLYFHISLER
jgi:hypothetical protein